MMPKKARQKGNNENRKAERGSNDRPAADGGLEVETDGGRGFSLLSSPPLSLHSPLSSSPSPPFSLPLFLFFRLLSIKMPLFRTLAKKS